METRSIYRCDEEVEALVRGFERCEISRAAWTHEAHLTVALWYAMHHDVEEAARRMRDGIHRFLDSHGVVSTPTSGYHETITVCWVRIIAAFAGSRPGESLAALANALAEHGTRDLLLRHYTEGRLMSVEARAGWVEPDLVPLP